MTPKPLKHGTRRSFDGKEVLDLGQFQTTVLLDMVDSWRKIMKETTTYMVVDLKVLVSSVYDDDPEHIKISFGESFFSSWREYFFFGERSGERLNMYFCMNVHLLSEQLVAVTQKLDELWKLDNLLLLRLLLLLLLRLPLPLPLPLRLVLLLLLLLLLLLTTTTIPAPALGGGFATKLYPAKGESLAKVQLKIGESSPCHI